MAKRVMGGFGRRWRLKKTLRHRGVSTRTILREVFKMFLGQFPLVEELVAITVAVVDRKTIKIRRSFGHCVISGDASQGKVGVEIIVKKGTVVAFFGSQARIAIEQGPDCFTVSLAAQKGQKLSYFDWSFMRAADMFTSLAVVQSGFYCPPAEEL